MLARVAAVVLLVPAILVAQIPADSRESAWRSDLAWFAHEFAAAQKDFDKLYPTREFDTAIKALTRALPAITDAEIVLGLTRVVASARVGHNNVRIPQEGPLAFHRLPINVQWFSDGLGVTAAPNEYTNALGLRVVRIGSLAPDRMVEAVAPFVAAETSQWLRVQSQTFMVMEEVLRSLKQIDPDGRVPLTVARADGSTFTIRIAPMPWRETGPLKAAADALSIPMTPARRDPNRYYRWEILPGTTALYIRYSRCADDPAHPFANFARDIFAAVDANPQAVDRVVIDLRANGGGNSSIIAPLLKGLRDRKALSAQGHLYVLVGPSTFSSALTNAWELRNMKAIAVGEAPGEKLNSYGEVRSLTLPNSKLVVQYSTKFFKLAYGNSVQFEPDVRVTRSIEDWLAGRDPILRAALGKKP